MHVKLIALGLSILTVVLSMTSTAEAYPGSIAGTSIKQCLCFNSLNQRITCPATCTAPSCRKVCSVDVLSLLSGLGNTTPGDSSNAAYAVNLFVEQASVFCVNRPGNAQSAQGQPFINEAVEIQATDLIEPASITKNGRALSEIVFTDKDIVDALAAAGAFGDKNAACPNANWQIRVFVGEMEVFGRLFRDEDGAGGACNLTNPGTFGFCTLGDAMSVQCNAPNNATVTAPFEYNCDTLCHNSDNKVVDCPVTPGVITPNP
jgi:hypothetical protein